MSLRWVDDDAPVRSLPAGRQAFYRGIEQTLWTHDPRAQARIEAEIREWLDEVSNGKADYASVKRNAEADWSPFERQAIYDATQDWDLSRWWCGLLLMKLAIDHSAAFMAYKPGEPGSEVSTAYFLDRRKPKN